MTPDARSPTTTSDDWQRRYRTADVPWDSGLVDRDLRRAVEAGEILPGTVLELGCGTGTNAVFLAQRGFTVTAVDFASEAVERTTLRARAAAVEVRVVCGDVTRLDVLAEPFDLLYDRGCYHCVRRAGQLGGYLRTVERLTRPGSRLLLLAGNPDSGEAGGPPKVRAADLCDDFERSFRLLRLAAMRFEDAGGVDGPLGWSSLWERR